VSGESVETSPNGARLVAAISTKQHREVPMEEGAMERQARCCHHLADMRVRLDTKQVDRFKAFFRTRIPFARPIVVIYRYKVVACCFCSSVVQSPNVRSQRFSLVAHIALPGSSHTSLWCLRVHLIPQVSALSGCSPRIVSLSLSDQKGMQLLILPDVSAGYPSIFLPVSLAQHPQKIAAGQQMICTVVRIGSF
jgi:hypothetical protein